MYLEKNRLFNPKGDRAFEKRRLVGGNSTNLFELNNIKYDWAMKLYRAMMNNFWIPEEIPLGNDAKDYKVLSDAEQKGYDKVISFLVFLDSLQTANLPNFAQYITAPEVNLCLSVQAFQEAVHSQSYGYILDTVVSSSKRDLIYNYWRDDQFLLNRNLVITSIYEEFHKNPTMENLVLACMANFCLEGIYFYSGFSFFYVLARQGKMCGTAQEIRYIQRDELTHVVMFQNILTTLRNENPEVFSEETRNKLCSIMDSAVQQEIQWGQYIIKDGILGLTDSIIEKYIKYLSNRRMSSVGLKPLYPEIEAHPMQWVEAFSSVNQIKTDFFEAKPTAYSKSSNVDWDEL